MKPPSALLRAVERALSVGDHEWVPQSGGTTNTVWRVGEVVVKRFHPSRASRLFPNDLLQEAGALQCLGPVGLAPQFLAKGTGWLAYRYQPGPSWTEGAEVVAALLYRLHQQGSPQFPLRQIALGKDALLAEVRAAMSLQGLDFSLPAISEEIEAQACFLHGDPVPGNIIMRAEGPILIDWQCPAWGDPVRDLALFLSPAMQHIYRGKPLNLDEEAAFLAAYPDARVKARLAALRPLLHIRIALHCQERARKGHARFAQAALLERAAAGLAA